MRARGEAESDGVLGALGRQSYVGVENPDVLEILVVTGADGDYELLEDRDSDESLVRTKIHWNDDEGILRVEAAWGFGFVSLNNENSRFVFSARTRAPNS